MFLRLCQRHSVRGYSSFRSILHKDNNKSWKYECRGKTNRSFFVMSRKRLAESKGCLPLGAMGAKPTRELPDIPADQLESVKTRLFAELNSDLPPNIGRLTQIIETNDWRLTTKTLDFLKSEYEYTPLHAAVAAQKVAYVEYFLERGCRARVGDRDLNSPLHTAVSSGNEVLVDLLLEYGGVDLILASNMKGNTPLHEAAKMWHRSKRMFTKIAEQCGQDELNAINSKGETVLHLACKKDMISLIEYLFGLYPEKTVLLDRAGASSGMTAMHYCTANGSAKSLRMLIQAGAKKNVTNKFGSTPLHLACETGANACIVELLSADGDTFHPHPVVLPQAKREYVGPVEKTLPSETAEDFVVVECRDVFGNTPLHYALGWSQNLENVSGVAKLADFKHSSINAKKRQAVTLDVIEQLLQVEVKHNKPTKRAKVVPGQLIRGPYAYSVAIPNSSEMSPLDFAKTLNQDNGTVALLEKYAPPAAELSAVVAPKSDTTCFSLQIASDLHIEFLSAKADKVERRNALIDHTPKAKYLGLLGDIGVPTKEHPSAAEDYRDFLLEQCKYYEKVIVLAGNHEFYHSTIDETMKTIQNICKENNKLLFLTKDSPSIVLDGVRVVGCTLWSHVPAERFQQVGYHLNDYRRIFVRRDADGEEALSPYDTTQMHLEDVEHIESEILAAKEAGQPIVILTHHGPLMEFGCSNPEFWTSPIRNAFATDMRKLFGGNVVAWAYGHTHWFHDMIIHGTRVISNQAGYVTESKGGYNPGYVLRIPSQAPKN